MRSVGTGPVEDRVLSGATPFGVFVSIGTLIFAGLILLAEQSGMARQFGYLAAGILLVAGIAVPAVQTRTMSPTEWLVARAGAHRTVAAMALSASLITGWMLVIAGGQFFAGSPLAMAWIVAPMLALAIGAFAIVPFVKQSGAATPGDLIARRFASPATSLAFGVVAAVAGILLLWSQFRFAGLLGGLLFSVDRWIAIVIAACLTGLTALPGGLRGILRVNAVIFVFLATAFLAPLAWISAALTGFPVPQLAFGYGALAKIGDIEQQLSVLGFARLGGQVDGMAAAGNPLTTAIVMCLFIALGLCAMPFVLGHYSATCSPAGARTTAGWAIFFIALVVTAIPALAAFAKLLLYHGILGLTTEETASGAGWLLEWSSIPSIFQNTPMARLCGRAVQDVSQAVAACGGNADYVIGPADLRMAGEVITLGAADIFALPAIFGALIGAALLSGTIASANAVAFSIGANLPAAITGPVPKEDRQSMSRLFRARLAIATALCAAAWLATSYETRPTEPFMWAMAIGAAIILPVLVGAIWWSRMNKSGTISGIIVGGLVLGVLAWANPSGAGLPAIQGVDLSALNAAMFGLPVTIATIVGGSLLSGMRISVTREATKPEAPAKAPEKKPAKRAARKPAVKTTSKTTRKTTRKTPRKPKSDDSA